jgi:hypothetical protein
MDENGVCPKLSLFKDFKRNIMKIHWVEWGTLFSERPKSRIAPHLCTGWRFWGSRWLARWASAVCGISGGSLQKTFEPLYTSIISSSGMIWNDICCKRIGLVIGRLHEDEVTFHACYHVRLTVFACRASKILMFNLLMALPANQGQSLGTVLRGWWTCQFMSIQYFWHAEGFLRE